MKPMVSRRLRRRQDSGFRGFPPASRVCEKETRMLQVGAGPRRSGWELLHTLVQHSVPCVPGAPVLPTRLHTRVERVDVVWSRVGRTTLDVGSRGNEGREPAMYTPQCRRGNVVERRTTLYEESTWRSTRTCTEGWRRSRRPGNYAIQSAPFTSTQNSPRRRRGPPAWGGRDDASKTGVRRLRWAPTYTTRRATSCGIRRLRQSNVTKTTLVLFVGLCSE